MYTSTWRSFFVNEKKDGWLTSPPKHHFKPKYNQIFNWVLMCKQSVYFGPEWWVVWFRSCQLQPSRSPTDVTIDSCLTGWHDRRVSWALAVGGLVDYTNRCKPDTSFIPGIRTMILHILAQTGWQTLQRAHRQTAIHYSQTAGDLLMVNGMPP